MYPVKSLLTGEWIQCGTSYSGTIQPYKRMKLPYLLLTCMNPDDIMLIETSQNRTNILLNHSILEPRVGESIKVKPHHLTHVLQKVNPRAC